MNYCMLSLLECALLEVLSNQLGFSLAAMAEFWRSVLVGVSLVPSKTDLRKEPSVSPVTINISSVMPIVLV